MIGKVIKKNIFLVIFSFIMLIMLTVGVSYALFYQFDENTTNQVIMVGTIDASLSSSTGVLSITNLSPKNYSELAPNENTYSFTVNNTGSYALEYEVFLVDNTANFILECENNGGCLDFSETPLESDYFSYINYRIDNVSNNFSDIKRLGKKTLGTGTVLSGEAKTYTIQIWLDENAPNDIIGKTASFNIKLNATAVDTPIFTTKDKVEYKDTIKIGDEEFYVLSNTNGIIRMIAKYNLRVGYDVSNTGEVLIDESDTSYNRQDPLSIGVYTPAGSSYLYKSVIHYSDEEHSVNQGVCENNQTCYSNYVGSLIKEKIDAYTNYLRQELGADVVGDAPTEEDYYLLREIDDYYKTSFWTKTSMGDSHINLVSIKYGSQLITAATDALTDYRGVRPVISVSEENIKRKLYLDSPNITVLTPTLDHGNLVIGSVIIIGTEEFYVVSENNGLVRMLAKDNVYCGDENNPATVYDVSQQLNSSSYIPFTDKEHEASQGECLNDNTFMFCYSNYKNSAIEYYANLYREALYEKYQVSVRVDLPTLNDLKAMDYSLLTKTFKYDGYSWAYSTNYWTKEALDNANIYTVSSTNTVDSTLYNETGFGLRPIVIIHKSQISNLP